MMSLINHFSLHSPLQAGQRSLPLPRQFEHLKQNEHSCKFCNVFKIVFYILMQIQSENNTHMFQALRVISNRLYAN